jgi:hypothetical protein
MASAMRNLTGEIMTRLQADSDVVALLANGADSIFHWINEQTDDVVGMPKPYISINPMPREDTVDFANRRELILKVEVEYVISDAAQKTETSFYDEAEKIDTVLRGDDLNNPTFGTNKAFRIDLTEDYIKENGAKKVVFELEYKYKQTK